MRGHHWGLCRRFDLVRVVTLVIGTFWAGGWASASILGTPENDSWSDLAFPSGLSGGFNSATKQLTLTASPSNDLEIGSEFGPSNVGRHYGSGGTLGGPFSATLNVSGVVVETDGTVTNGGTVAVTFNGAAPGSIGTDYGIVPGDALLLGNVVEVLLDATGANTLDILFSITGGALQNINPALGTNFSPLNLGILRFSSIATPDDGVWDENFGVLSGATLDVYGVVPELRYTVFVIMGAIMLWAGGTRDRLSDRGINPA